MALEVFLIIIVGAIFIFLIRNLTYFKNSGLSKRFLSYFFILKVLFAFSYGALQKYYYGYGDTFRFQRGGNQIYQIGKQNKAAYFDLVFMPIKKRFPKEYKELNDGAKVIHYGHPRSYMMVRIIGLINLVAMGKYSVQALFFAFFSFVGCIGIYKFFREKAPKKEALFRLALFFSPSILYWGSGMHKEAVVIFCIGLILNAIRKTNRNYLFIIFSLVISFLIFANIRNYILLLFLPPLFIYLLFNSKKYILPIFFTAYSIGILAFFNVSKLSPNLNLVDKLVAVQDDFLSLKGRSNIEAVPLEPTFVSFLEHTPAALVNSFLRPFPHELKTILYAIASIETYLIVFLFAFVLLFARKKKFEPKEMSLIWFCLFFTFSYYVFLGLTVTNLGALARYKTIGLLFFLTATVLLADTEKLKKLVKQIPLLNKIS